MSRDEEEFTLTENINNDLVTGYRGIPPIKHGYNVVKSVTGNENIYVRGYAYENDEIMASYREEEYDYKSATKLPPGIESYNDEIERTRRTLNVPVKRYKAPGMAWFIIYIRIIIAISILLSCYVLCHQRYPTFLPWPEYLDPWVQSDNEDT